MPHELLDHATDLYETDFYQWTVTQAAQLRALQPAGLDWEHLAEEIEDVGRSESRELESRLRQILLHMLKLRYAEDTDRERAERGWRNTWKTQRLDIATLLRKNPSLHRTIPEAMAEAYPKALLDAATALDCDDTIFPNECPWGMAEVLSDPVWDADERRQRDPIEEARRPYPPLPPGR